MTTFTNRGIAIAASAITMVAFLLVMTPVHAAEDPNTGLFINLFSVDAVPAGHAFEFAGKQLKRGHPVAVFLNGKAVWIAAAKAPQLTYPGSGKTLQAMLQELMKAGAEVIVCQACAKAHGVAKDDLIEGALLGNPERVGKRLFDPAYKTISW